MRRDGFTLVELVVVVLIIAALLALAISIIQRRQQAEMQALADASPHKVFTLTCAPTKRFFDEGEDLVFSCEISNPTRYSLDVNLPRPFFAQDLDQPITKLFWALGDYPPRSTPQSLKSDGRGPFTLSTTIGTRSSLKFETVLLVDLPGGNLSRLDSESLQRIGSVIPSNWSKVTHNRNTVLSSTRATQPGREVEIALADGAVPESGEIIFFFDHLKSNAMEFRIEPSAQGS